MELFFKQAEPSELSAISAFVNSAYRGESSKKGWTTEADLLDGQRTDAEILKTQISGHNQLIFSFFNQENKKIVGCVYLRKEDSAAYLGMLTVAPELQGSGIGKKILSHVENFVFTEWKINKMRMRVISARHELISWYQRRGYQLTSQKEPFPYGNEKFGLPKVNNLEFIVLQKNLES